MTGSVSLKFKTFLSGKCGLSKQVVSQGSSLSREVSMHFLTIEWAVRVWYKRVYAANALSILNLPYIMTIQVPEYSGTCLERPPHWTFKCGLTRQMVFDDRFNDIEMYDLLPGISGLSRQVVSPGSGLSR